MTGRIRAASRRTVYRAAQLTVVLALILGGCAAVRGVLGPESGPVPQSAPAATGTGPGGLTIAPEDTGHPYDRDDWPTWTYVANGCDRREMTLKEQGRNVITGKGCTVVAGEWSDPYTGAVLVDRDEIEVDHIVSAPATDLGQVSAGQAVGSIPMTADVITFDTPVESTGDGAP